ncbi:hypothetical protein BC833DRAFT_576474 [Globomyces pollinis-pini]|nr:hypothetical protein BC833DRAFT_576474 [Globomyces pollinis-pini]
MGFGILSNIIVFEAGFIMISRAIPYYIDDTISVILDASQHPAVRKEALCVTNNFIAVLKQNASKDDHDWVDALFEIFRNTGFLPKLNILISSTKYFPFQAALAELLLNMALANTVYMADYFQKNNSFQTLLDVDIINELGNQQQFIAQKHQMDIIYSDLFVQRDFCILKLLVVLTFHEPDILVYLSKHSSVISFLAKIINDCILDSIDCDVLGLIFQCLSMLMEQSNPHFEFLHTLHNENALIKLFQVIYQSISSSNRDLKIHAIRLLSIILHFQSTFLQVVDISDILQSNITLDSGSFGHLVFTTFIDQLISNSQLSNHEILLIEKSLEKICQFKWIKIIAIQNYIPLRIDKLLKQLVDKKAKVFKHKDSLIHTCITIITNLCFNCVEAKVAFAQTSLFNNLCFLLNDGDSNHELKLYTLNCVCVVISNCNLSKLKLLNHKPGSNCHSILDCCIIFCNAEVFSLGYFDCAIAILQVLLNHPEAKSVLLKNGYLGRLNRMFESSIRNKNVHQTLGILKSFIVCAKSKEGQTSLIHTDDFFTSLVALLNVKTISIRKHSLILLNLLALERENKSYFLIDENFIPYLTKVLSSNSKELIEVGTSLLWTLRYDFEKSRTEFRKANFHEILTTLQDKLNTKTMSKEFNLIRSCSCECCDEMTDEVQTQSILHNISSVLKLIQ